MDRKPKICIIGAGFSGLCTAIKLKTELGLDSFTVFEGCTEVGGTWFVNTYPGCACDVPSHFYSYSFAPKYDWSHAYSYQPEILEYMKDVTQKFGIYPHIRFQTKVETLRWDEKEMKWRVSVLDMRRERVESDTFDIVINGTGKIRIPHYPKEYLNFTGGPLIHSAEWDHTVNLKGKRVGVIGTGASAIQIITTLAKDVAHMTVFQRKAPYVLPRMQTAYSDTAKWIFDNVPFAYRLSRMSMFWMFESLYLTFVNKGFMNATSTKFANWFRHKQIKDPELLKKTEPKFTLGCKRILFSENYYTTLEMPHVDLVAEKIESVAGNTVKTVDGKEVELDALILATGYQPHDFFSPMKIYGKGGVDILEEWIKDRPQGYLGICANDMPNLFTILGPYSALGHSSNLYTIECQVYWTILAIKSMMQKGAKCMTVTKKAEGEFMKFMDTKWKTTVWGNNECGSWYLDRKGINTTLWPDHNVAYWNWCKQVDQELFDYSY